MSDKKELRRIVREKLFAMPEEEIAQSDSAIYYALSTLAEFIAAPRVFAYYSLGREVDTHRIIDLSIELGKTVALPVCYPDKSMEFAEISGPEMVLTTGQMTRPEDALIPGLMAIPEPGPDAKGIVPEKGDVILVPALCFDTDGYRLGQGGGYYDRYLLTCKAYSIGLGRDVMLRQVPREIHDLPVRCLVTERGKIKAYRDGHHHHESDGE